MKLYKGIMLSVVATVSLQAGFSTQEFLYKDPRVMGMGAANTAVGGYSTALFYNPAGLITIKQSHGWEVEVLGLSVSASDRFQDFADDIEDVETAGEAADVLDDYSGDSFNLNIANYTSVSYHMPNDTVWSVGLLASVDGTFIPHGNGSQDGLLETHGRGYGGLFVAGAKRFENVSPKIPGKLTVGAGIKYINQKAYEAPLDIAEISNNSDDLGEYLQDNYETEDSGIAIDFGLLYEPNIEKFAKWNPKIGLSIMNLGNLDFDNYGSQPTTVNMGLSISPELPKVDSFTFAIDLVDITNAQQARVYNATKEKYEDADIDFDFVQHLRMGVNVGIIDNKWVLASASLGLYQGSITAGVDLQLAGVKLQFATYEEQLGSEVGQIEDRRYIFGLGIGW